jgi:glycosyltransferase involved in cell wall biosynthesis
MSELPGARLFTTFGTVIHVDPASSELRHGSTETSPANALLVAESSGRDPCRGWLAHETEEFREPIVCTANGSWSAPGGGSVAPTLLDLVQLRQGLIGLRSGNLYLCAEPDGRVTLSRAWCSLWESFLPSEDWCTTPAEGTEHHGIADATIDWGRIASFTIDPSLRLASGQIVETRRLVVAVYTIALNEAAHVERWANSAADADYRIVADTGSTDATVERLTQAGVTVHRIAVRPWRFDDARNAAMALIPSDVDVCLSMDMDEFLEPGWRPKLEAVWTSEMTALHCRLALRSSLDDPLPKTWPAKKFHARWGYRFKRAVHEALFFTAGEEVAGDGPDILVHHIQDRWKDTRAQYLPLLEVAHKEDPEDSQICFWLGRDYMWANRIDQGIEVLERYLALPSSSWTEERSEAMRCLARMQPDRKMAWLDRARIEAPHRREIWLDLAEEFHCQEDWLNLFWACTNGIEKTYRTWSYLDDQHSWGPRLFEFGAAACAHLDLLTRALEWGQKASELDPGNERLKNNLASYIRLREKFCVDT